MREIEVKAHLKDKDAVVVSLKRKGIKLSKSVKQHDVVYGIAGTKDNAAGSVWLRIRTEDDQRSILTLKKQHGGDLDSIENETEVANAQEAEAIVKQLGFSIYSDLTKHRQKAHFEGIEICLDKVEDLGWYIEAEKLAKDDADGNAIRASLWVTLNGLGLDQKDEVFDGYDVLHKKAKAKN